MGSGRMQPATESSPAPATLRPRLIGFMKLASIEATPHDRDALAGLPQGTTVYVAHVPKATLGEVAEFACEVESMGLLACPHLVARRIGSVRELDAALARLDRGGVARALLVAGDLPEPAGPFRSTLDLLESGRLAGSGIRSLGVAGHPAGHPRVEPEVLWDAMRRKQDYAERTGVRMHLVSQFGFRPEALADWDRQLAGHGISLPVHAGIAGPASLTTLLRFAVLCGIVASVGALATDPGRIRALVRPAEETLLGIVRVLDGALAQRVVQPHVFSFGGVRRTAEWLLDLQAGRFTIDAAGLRVGQAAP